MNVMQLDDSSSEGSSSSDEDLDFLFLEAAFPEPRLLGPRLNMEDISEIDCEQMFRFQKQDMDRLLEALQIPDSYTSHQGSVFTGMESLMILLRRLSYPNRWCDLVPIFGRTEPELSMAFDMVIMKHLNVHKLRRCINHAYRIYISGMHSHHVIIDFRSLMICIQDSVLV
ncbi:unnamed protein product [Porites evermanni]|uniref:Uncharacterized protein n=3 Tax=Scleractinia TaxID=6125 RepID=A0ABN8MP04_9CNID|nr:unnamed protein product [Porites evermanni]CAH3124422.1 unnamed protein product [Pocillopora meandrina]CAH3140463.1 unnamed protein product [Porites lobata]CAH3029116.1 unnamed protein product [Porites evermanni]CAH3142505.1 unnamed protein product [Porites evermanni]